MEITHPLNRYSRVFIALSLMLLLIGLWLGLGYVNASPVLADTEADDDAYIVLAWNDLGMHCYNANFEYLAVLPPYNTLYAQVIRLGSPPEVITTGITLTYEFIDNSYSVGKSNFWDYDQDLFGVNLPDNVGLTGKGMTGTLDLHGDAWVAEGIPLTEYRDSDYEANSTNPTPYPYQLGIVKVYDVNTNALLAETTVVGPVSTEMHCDNCHYDGAFEGIATGSVELNILALHDDENMSEYPPEHSGRLENSTPVLCAECHSSNALGAAGVTGIPSLSNALHETHSEVIDAITPAIDGCYQCHPGPETQCLRDVMSEDYDMDCTDCHGTMSQVAQNPNPWLNEPRCDDAGCHDSGLNDQNQDLYRLSTGHGDLYCAGCHDSPHAIAPSGEANDAIKFIDLQGVTGMVGVGSRCYVCHTGLVLDAGPHGTTAKYILLPLVLRQ